jgi:hypothetical protein
MGHGRQPTEPDATTHPAPRILTHPPDAEPIPRASQRNTADAESDAVVTAATRRTSAAEAAERPPSDPKRMPLVRVMRMLHDTRPGAAEVAVRELHNRGLNHQQVELAKDLTNHDPAVRRRLVDRLPQVPGLAARPWLLWLCQDDDADVRLAALTFLATSTDPQLREHVRQIADRDVDPRIEALGRRLSGPIRDRAR